MRLDGFLILPVIGALLVGFATPASSRSSVDPALTPNQIVHGLTDRKLTSLRKGMAGSA